MSECKPLIFGQGETMTIRCTFSPREAAQYQIDAPIYLDGQTKVAYLNMEVLGEGTHPRLAFDTKVGRCRLSLSNPSRNRLELRA